MIKSTQTWRQVIKLDKYDFCTLLNGIETIKFVNEFGKFFKKNFKSLPTKCPFRSGNYSISNVPITDSSGDEMNRGLTIGELPNGIYRHVIKIHTDDDPKAFAVYWHTEVYIRLNEDQF